MFLILRNPNDDWKSKIDYCKRNNIPYLNLEYRQYSLPMYERPKDPLNKEPHKIQHIENWSICYSSGQLAACVSKSNDERMTLQADIGIPKTSVGLECPACPNVGGFEIFYSDEEWKELDA